MRAALPVDAVAEAVEAACDAAGTPATVERAALIADIVRLARGVSAAAGTSALALRLDVVQGDSCRRFHIDNVRLRLLCTYRGDGTKYGMAGSGDVPDPVHRVARGMPAVFRGRRWPGEVTGLAHRSPPIAGTGQTRLLLVIDPDEPDEDD